MDPRERECEVAERIDLAKNKVQQWSLVTEVKHSTSHDTWDIPRPAT